MLMRKFSLTLQVAVLAAVPLFSQQNAHGQCGSAPTCSQRYCQKCRRCQPPCCRPSEPREARETRESEPKPDVFPYGPIVESAPVITSPLFVAYSRVGIAGTPLRYEPRPGPSTPPTCKSPRGDVGTDDRESRGSEAAELRDALERLIVRMEGLVERQRQLEAMINGKAPVPGD